MPHDQRVCTRHRLRPVVLAFALCGGAAWAKQTPYYIGASQGFTRQSNVFASSGNAQSDTISSTGVLGGVDLQLGRQHVYANGTAQTNRHQRFDQLNNLSYGLTTGLDWQTIERLSGGLRYATNQSLVNYADVQFPVGIKDVQKTQDASASVRYGISSSLGADASVSHRAVDYSAAEDRRAFKQNGGSLGLQWGGTGILTLGAALRLTKGDYPSALIVAPVAAIPATPTTPPVPAVIAVYGPDKTDRKDIDFTGSWTPSGVSTLTARVSLTRETHSQPVIPKLSGVTGSIAWDYRPTGKLQFIASLTRDTGSETAFAALPVKVIPVRNDNRRINTTAALDAKYAATAKIQVNAQLRHSDGSVLNSGGGTNDGSTNSISVGASYAITRSIDASCDASYESRSHSYNSNSIGCTARFTLR